MSERITPTHDLVPQRAKLLNEKVESFLRTQTKANFQKAIEEMNKWFENQHFQNWLYGEFNKVPPAPHFSDPTRDRDLKHFRDKIIEYERCLADYLNRISQVAKRVDNRLSTSLKDGVITVFLLAASGQALRTVCDFTIAKNYTIRLDTTEADEKLEDFIKQRLEQLVF